MTPDERAARIHHHEYSGEGIREHAERIVALEELVLDMWRVLDGCFPVDCMWHCPRFDEHCCGSANETCRFSECMRELGVTE